MSLVYYNCPTLCSQLLKGLAQDLRSIPMVIGKDFNVVTLSIDPTDQPALAEARRSFYLAQYGNSNADWHFLTGNASEIEELSGALGLRHIYDSDSKQFAYAVGIVVLTPTGKISRYFYGVSFSPLALRRALLDAAAGQNASAIGQSLVFCYHYDPRVGRYGLLIHRVIQALGILTVVGLALLIVHLRRNEHYAFPELMER